jgi:hypothetical protein
VLTPSPTPTANTERGVEDCALRVCAQPRTAVLPCWGLGGAGLEPGGLEEEWRTPSAAVGRSVEDALGARVVRLCRLGARVVGNWGVGCAACAAVRVRL